MTDYLLVLNAGSSSIKFTLYRTDGHATIAAEVTGQIDGIGTQPRFKVCDAGALVLVDAALESSTAASHADALSIIHTWLKPYWQSGTLLAVGHRVVHGGAAFSAPVLIDAGVLTKLERLIPLAPLHQAHNLAPIRALLHSQPTLPQVACFDTAFHRTQPELAQHFALPKRFWDDGIRRYGFHGLSYEYIVSILPELDPPLARRKLIVAHLGNGASLCAIQNGQSIATSMGFSPLDGLMMGSRCGALDPGVMLYLMDHYGLDARALEQLLYYQSGLLGVSGISNDMRLLLASDDPDAQLAIDLFIYRIVRETGAMAAVLGGLEAIIFTGGIGEHASLIRQRIGEQIAWSGLELDLDANAAHQCRISTAASAVSAWVVATDENVMIARHTLETVLQRQTTSIAP